MLGENVLFWSVRAIALATVNVHRENVENISDSLFGVADPNAPGKF